MSQFVRVFTGGRGLEDINRDIVSAARGGSRVLVKAAPVADGIGEKPDGDKGAVADWAQALASENGLAWSRVGHDVLFRRPE